MFLHYFVKPLEAKLPVGKAYSLMLRSFDRNDLELLLRTELDPAKILADYSAESDPWPKCLMRTLEAADRQGWFVELLSAAKKVRPEHQLFCQGVDQLLTRMGMDGDEDAVIRKRTVRTNLGIVLGMMLAVCVWCYLVLGNAALVSVLLAFGIIGGAGVFDSRLNLRLVRFLDELFAWAIGHRRTTKLLLAVGLLGFVASLFVGAVDVDAEVGVPMQYRQGQAEAANSLRAGLPQLFFTNLVDPTTLNVTAAGYSVKPVSVYPWWQRRIYQADLEPETYLIVYPADSLMFHPNSPVALEVVISGSEEVHTVSGYVGEALMLGPSDNSLEFVEAEDRFPTGRLDNRPAVSKRHSVKTRIADGTKLRLTTTSSDLTLLPGQTVTFRCEMVSPLGTRSCYTASVPVRQC